jgi:hypothetical protein
MFDGVVVALAKQRAVRLWMDAAPASFACIFERADFGEFRDIAE